MNATDAQVSITVATGVNPGAVAIVDLAGPGCRALLTRLTDRADWRHGEVRLVALPNIDTVTSVLLTERHAQIMPHGGPRVVQRVLEHLVSLGVAYDAAPPADARYVESRTALESDMLDLLAQAKSPAAIDLLLAQPRLWQRLVQRSDEDLPSARILHHTAQFDRLVVPARVVVVGRPNVGKSTLHNRMAGRTASVVSDAPGTTRDWVGGPVALRAEGVSPSEATSHVVVDWIDTPGLRAEGDSAEHDARRLAGPIARDANVLVAMRDGVSAWPERDEMGREPDLWVMNKCDLMDVVADANGASDAAPLPISASDGLRIDALESAVLKKLGLHRIPGDACWAFSETLRHAMGDGDGPALRRYVGAV